MFQVNYKTIPTIQVCEDVLKEKYLKENESCAEDVFKRVAKGLASVEKPELQEKIEKLFFQNMKDGAIGAGRIMSTAGTNIKATLSNCFVQGVGDSISGFDKDGLPGIYKALEMAAETMRMGGGVGYNFSNIRPKGAWIETTKSMASGPCSYMNVFDASCTTVESLGCFAGDTLILTTNGLIPIKTIVESKKEFLVETHLGPKKVITKFKNGIKPVFKVITKYGYEVKVTEDHKFAQFEDGKIVTKPLHEITKSDNLSCLVLVPNMKQESNNFTQSWESHKLGKDLSFLTKNSIKDKSFSFTSVIKPWVFIPAYIAGIIDEIGVIENNAVKLYSACKEFIQETQIVLATLGVPCTYSCVDNFHTVIISSIEGLKRLKKLSYKFTSLNLFPAGEASQDNIGHNLSDLMAFDFSDSKASQEELIENDIYGTCGIPLSSLVESSCDAQFTNTISDEILSVGLLGEEETYDLEVEDVHLLSGNGLYTSNSRRGAQMGILDISHPDIEEFIKAKQQKGRWNNFNVSVGVTDEFMRAVKNNTSWVLHHKAKPHPSLKISGKVVTKNEESNFVYKIVQARDLWDSIMKNTYDHAEPGIIFHDTVNTENNLYYCETLNATNPCAEENLPNFGCCDLGPIILPFLVNNPFGIGGEPSFNFAKLKEMVKIQVRLLDNVLDATHWPLEEQRKEAMAKRRVGVGFTGLGNVLAMAKLKYDSQDGRALAKNIARVMRDAAYESSVELAKEKGPFPMFDADLYLNSEFALRLPYDIRDSIEEHGIRNSHLLSIAPTGTVSLAFGNNTSNGIEPPFSYTYDRKKREQDGSFTTYEVSDYAYRLYRKLSGSKDTLPDYFATALEMTVEGHMEMLEAVQPFIDSSISKTVNIPEDYPFENFKEIYYKAWEAKLKGLATYRPNSTLGSILSVAPEAKESPTVKSESKSVQIKEEKSQQSLAKVVIETRPKGPLPGTIEKIEYNSYAGKNRFYLTVGYLPLTNEGGKTIMRPIEFFLKNLDNGASDQWCESSMRMLSLAARGGFLDRALKDMQKVTWDKGPVRLGETVHVDGNKVPKFHKSEAAAVAFAIEESIKNYGEPYIDREKNEKVNTSKEQQRKIFSGETCSNCGATAVVKRDGCEICENCGQMGSCG